MKLSLKNKILILVTLPSIGLMILISMIISVNFQEYQGANTAVKYVTYSNAASKLIHELQKERGRSSMFLGGKISHDVLMEQRNLSLKAAEIFNNAIPKTEIKDKLEGLINKAFSEVTEARAIVDSKGAAVDSTRVFGQGIYQLILSETLVAQTALAFGEEKKLLSVVMLDIAKENAGKLRANITNVLNSNRDLSMQQVDVISAMLSGVNENLSSPTLIITDETKLKIENFKETPEWKKAKGTIAIVLENADKGNYNQNGAEFFDSITIAIDKLGEIIFAEQEKINSVIIENKDAITSKLILIIVLNALLLLSVIILSIYFVRSITKPIQILTEKLHDSSALVNGTSEKVSESAEKLSSNSTEQAAAIQESVTSFEEITQMIGKTAENAKTSQEVSKISFETAQQGQVVVSELNTSIKEISEANNKIKDRVAKSNMELEDISKIISEIGLKTRVINDIVFQTKLLSFNASVEAARAGEQGKGFAVVAEEIGKLATMSGSAADEISEVLSKSLHLVNMTIENTKKEINQIIEQSKEKVERGSMTAIKCGEALNEIVEKVQEVNKLVVEIAQASTEQSLGVNQISMAMNELDRATHSNSISSIETAQFGQQLKGQAHALNRAIEELSKVING